MNWFFDQVLYGTGICDYKVNNFRNRRLSSEDRDKIEKDSLSGIAESDSAGTDSDNDDLLYKAVVQVERGGEVMLPVDVLVHFENGDEVTETWDGRSRYKDFTYEGRGKVEWVKIDPEYKLRMDVNFINNSMTDDPDRIPIRNLMNKFLIAIEFYINFITL